MPSRFDDMLVLIKGAGDLASGVAWRLHRCGFGVVMTELPHPLAVRRMVSFAEAVYAGEQTVEEVTAVRAEPSEVPDLLREGLIPLLVDPTGEAVTWLAPTVLVDAIMAKRNLGTRREDAPLVIALGPGFQAGVDCHAVVETHRGHQLGRIIWAGSAQADTGSPGQLTGVAGPVDRVLRSPGFGHLQARRQIGERVAVGETVALLAGDDGATQPLIAPCAGVLRGLIHPAVWVSPGLKVGDLDPRAEVSHCTTISDKSLAIAGGVLEAILCAR